MRPDIDTQDELLIAVALCRYSVHHEEAEPRLASRAWDLAAKIADAHGLDPSEVVLQLESGGGFMR